MGDATLTAVTAGYGTHAAALEVKNRKVVDMSFFSPAGRDLWLPMFAAAPDLLAFAEAVAEYDEYTDDTETEDPRKLVESLNGVLRRLEDRARAVVARARGGK